MKTQLAFALIAALATTSLAAGPGDVAVAYEGFSGGAAPDLAGTGSGFGWTGLWEHVTGGVITHVTSPTQGLAFPNLATQGGSARSGMAIPDLTGYQRNFTPITGDVMYVSYLIRPEPNMTNWYQIRFGLWPNQVDLGVPIGSMLYGIGLGDGFGVVSNIPAQVGVTRLLALEIRHNPGSMTTTYNLYVDPVPGQAQPTFPSATSTRPGLKVFGSWAELRGYGGYSFDELRVGTTWGSVTPAANACVPDCDGDGSLTIDDFICFQTSFAIGDPYADCDGDGVLTIDDFICFQTMFAIGC